MLYLMMSLITWLFGCCYPKIRLINVALKYIDLTLTSGYLLSVEVFTECVWSCVNTGRLDTLVSIIERCKVCMFCLSFVNIYSVDLVDILIFLLLPMLSENGSKQSLMSTLELVQLHH